ncbi:hypothetical protein M431DRAFT_431014 [Trichoderma harzianum CBS 226.95]|uniref:Uncharacterized protein n=1 Tax=Trichoderma harzianum CBS 226.95 TaxID=983964 RepID=A0A2T4ACS0_TRIHA|nr:hypothetical protein M431DRAFT_431014 [Trichoderma harzianum CBS 226.95]PTB54871.1 hypothetical protein M431DRAFT_431014 [Trichoderma harzianum CBS 226.95]
MILLQYTGGGSVQLISSLFVHDSKTQKRMRRALTIQAFPLRILLHFPFFTWIFILVISWQSGYSSSRHYQNAALTRRHLPCLTGAFPTPKSAHPPYQHLS